MQKCQVHNIKVGGNTKTKIEHFTDLHSIEEFITFLLELFLLFSSFEEKMYKYGPFKVVKSKKIEMVSQWFIIADQIILQDLIKSVAISYFMAIQHLILVEP